MGKLESPLHLLTEFLPPAAFPEVERLLRFYKVHLTITRERRTVLGDYRSKHQDKNHRISVNGNLNPYAFLVTLLHELAHLTTFERFGNRVAPHGKEWKQEFAQFLHSFIKLGVFPEPLVEALRKTMLNPAASSCADEDLLRALRKYDPPSGKLLVEELVEGEHFIIPPARIFIRQNKVRKRIRCQEILTGKWYLFSPLYEVLKWNNE